MVKVKVRFFADLCLNWKTGPILLKSPLLFARVDGFTLSFNIFFPRLHI